MVLYDDLVTQLNNSYEISRDPHNYVDDLKGMRKAANIEKIISLYNKITENNYWVFRGQNNIAALEQEINTNILRIFKEIAAPSEAQFLNCLVNLRGDYNQWAGFLIKEAINKKNLASSEANAREVLSVKRKYYDAWKRLKDLPKNSNGYYKVLVEVGSLLDKMNGYGYIHTKSEKWYINDNGLAKTSPIVYILYAVFIIGFIALLIWLEPIWPWLFVFGLMFWILGKI